MTGDILDRRAVLGAGLISLTAGSLAACATPRERDILTVNLTAAPVPAQTGTRLETAFDQARRMTVPVFIDGRGPFQFVVDTGANRTVVSRQLAESLGLEAGGSAPVHGIAGVEPAPLYRLRRLRVGETFANALAVPGLDAEKLGADGLLGVDVLRNRRVSLNFAENRFDISVSSKGARLERGHDTRLGEVGPQIVAVPARYRFGQLVIVGAEVAGAPVTAFIDSGAQVSVGNPALRQAVERLRPELLERLVETPLISATGQTARGEYAILPDLRLGGLRMARMTTVFADLHIFRLWQLDDRPAILIGVDVLRQFSSVTLDFGRREVVFETTRGRRVR